jgi:hypothetical protein
MAAGPVSDFVNSLSNLEDVPFGDTFEFAGTGSTAAIVVTGNSLCAAKDSSGQAVQLDQPSADFSGGSADQQFDVDSTFSTTEGETYQVVCDGSGDGSFAVVAFPENLSTIAAGAGIGIAGGFLMVIGVALLIASLNPVVPVDPLAQRRRKPPLDDGRVDLRDLPLAELPRQVGRRGTGLGQQQDSRHRCVEPAHHPEEIARGQRAPQDAVHAQDSRRREQRKEI